MRQPAEEVKRMELLTSLGRDDGQSLPYEVVTLALIIFAIFGALSLLGKL
jgi:hypothetical protein